MEQALTDANERLFSLETKRPLNTFDIIGFSLLYGMCYINVLSMLALSDVPLRAAARGENDPIVVCGGPCCCNPAPIAPFFDAILIGDGEEMTAELAKTVMQARQEGVDRQEILRRVACIEGAYVPMLHDPSKRVVRRIVRNWTRRPLRAIPSCRT